MIRTDPVHCLVGKTDKGIVNWDTHGVASAVMAPREPWELRGGQLIQTSVEVRVQAQEGSVLFVGQE